MLLWAVFTLGYLMGVLLTLKLLGERDHLEVSEVSSANYLAPERSPWLVFSDLTRVNVKPGTLSAKKSTL